MNKQVVWLVRWIGLSFRYFKLYDRTKHDTDFLILYEGADMFFILFLASEMMFYPS